MKHGFKYDLGLGHLVGQFLFLRIYVERILGTIFVLRIYVERILGTQHKAIF